MAETTSLLNWRTLNGVPRVRIPLSPPLFFRSTVYSGFGAVRLAHRVWDAGAVGSNPATPTINFYGINRYFSTVYAILFLWGLAFSLKISCKNMMRKFSIEIQIF